MTKNGKAEMIAMLMAVGLLGWACRPAAVGWLQSDFAG
jgi:hypothetical protein